MKLLCGLICLKRVVLNNGFKGMVFSEPLMPDGPTMRQTLNSVNKTKQGSGIRQHHIHPLNRSSVSHSLFLMQVLKRFITVDDS